MKLGLGLSVCNARPVAGGGGGGDPEEIVIAFAGQSNSRNYFNSVESSTTVGIDAFVAELEALYPTTTITTINGGVSGSYASKLAHDAAAAGTNDYWWDDTGAGAAGTCFTDFETAVTNAGKTMADIQILVWSQGESDGAVIPGSVSKVQYRAAMHNIYDNFRAECSALEAVFIHKIGRRPTVARAGLQEIDEVQNEIIAADADVHLGCETYDLTYIDENHLDNAGITAAGTRVGRNVARYFSAAYASYGNGALYTSASISGREVTLAYTLDGASPLGGYAGSPVDFTPSPEPGFFRIYDPNGTEITGVTVSVISADDIKLTLPAYPTSDLTIYGRKSAMENVDTGSFITDAQGLPIRTAKTTQSVTATGDWVVDDGASVTFTTSDTSLTYTLDTVDTNLCSIFPKGVRMPSDDANGGFRDFCMYPTLTNSTTLTVARHTTATNTVGHVWQGDIVEWPSDMVDSVQRAAITLTTTTTSGTATITSVDTSRSIVRVAGVIGGIRAASSSFFNMQHNAVLTDATTVTVTSSAGISSGTRIIYVEVIQFKTGVIASKEDVTCTIATSATTGDDAISAVDRRRSIIFYRGARRTAGTGTTFNYSCPSLAFTSDTNVRASRHTSSVSESIEVYATVVQFNEGFVSVQNFEVTASGTADTGTKSDLIQVDLNNSFLNALGFRTAYNATTDEGVVCGVITMSDAHTCTLTRNNSGTSADLIHSAQLVSFV